MKESEAWMNLGWNQSVEKIVLALVFKTLSIREKKYRSCDLSNWLKNLGRKSLSVFSCAATSDRSEKTVDCKCGTWMAWPQCVSGSGGSTRLILQTSSCSLPMSTRTASPQCAFSCELSSGSSWCRSFRIRAGHTCGSSSASFLLGWSQSSPCHWHRRCQPGRGAGPRLLRPWGSPGPRRTACCRSQGFSSELKPDPGSGETVKPMMSRLATKVTFDEAVVAVVVAWAAPAKGSRRPPPTWATLPGRVTWGGWKTDSDWVTRGHRSSRVTLISAESTSTHNSTFLIPASTAATTTTSTSSCSSPRRRCDGRRSHRGWRSGWGGCCSAAADWLVWGGGSSDQLVQSGD